MPDNRLPAPSQSLSVELPSGTASMSKHLAAAMEPPMVGVTGENGYDRKPGIWKCPSSVSQEVRLEANQRAGLLRSLIETPAHPMLIREWLRRLGPLVAGNLTVDDARAKLDAYVPRLQAYPMGCFTAPSLDRTRFEFFPTYGALCTFLDGILSDMKAQAEKCQKLARADGRKQEDDGPWTPPTQSQRDSVGAYLDDAFGPGWRSKGLIKKFGVES